MRLIGNSTRSLRCNYASPGNASYSPYVLRSEHQTGSHGTFGMFVDETRIKVSGGRGGNGAVSFHREKYRPKGGPDGGNGGRAGSVVLIADPSVGSLVWLRDHPQQRASSGGPGSGNNKSGADGEDLQLKVPPGTVVKDTAGTVLADLVSPDDRYLASRGGRGGRGNASFLSGDRRAPSFAELGEPGEERWLFLEIRLATDVAVIGYPNAGKSTLVSAVSRARPKIADYPFTTLEPQLGVVEVEDERFTICDIPGLIEGAHEGRGLGHKFLRHAERSSVFVHLVDVASDRDPLNDYRIVRRELEGFGAGLEKRAEVVCLNKIDLVEEEVVSDAAGRFRAEKIEPLAISAKEARGLEELKTKLSELVRLAREQKTAEGFELFRTEPEKVAVSKERDGGWRVKGGSVERWVAMTDLSNPEGLAYLQSRLERAGIEKLLAEAGARPGDDVRIGDAVLEWWP
jgi:GTP-binding protein